jgi:hypothetical protein
LLFSFVLSSVLFVIRFKSSIFHFVPLFLTLVLPFSPLFPFSLSIISLSFSSIHSRPPCFKVTFTTSLLSWNLIV